MRVPTPPILDRLTMPEGLRLAAVVAAGVALLFAGSCQAPLEQKKGYVGDFCNGSDKECRSGLVCQDGICQSVNNARDVCDVVCDKYDTCNVQVQTCRPSCLRTLSEWTKDNTLRYRDCHKQAQCSEFKNRERPWNYCYNKLPEADQNRLDVCNTLESQSRSCLNDQNIPPKGRIENMKRACKTEARTIGDQRWSNENALCDDQKTDDGKIRCVKHFQCLNRTLELEGEDRMPTSPNEGSD